MGTKNHPTGPTLSGQPKCGPGHIWDHQAGHCIPLVVKDRRKAQDKHSSKRRRISIA